LKVNLNKMSTVCNQCDIEKPNDAYYSHYKSRCKECVEAIRKLKRSEKYNKKKNLDIKVLCLNCNIEKSVKDFYASNQHTCKECVKQKTKERADKNPQKKKEEDRLWREANKERKQETDKKWREENKERKKATDDANRLKNKDNEEYKQKVKNSRKQWREKNADYKKQPHIKIKENIRSRIKSFLKEIKKKESTTKYLGCTQNFFKNWLEYQFDSNMNWENYGSYWHMDHVIGCNNFETDEESLKQCFHWSNTRPLEKKRNISKNDNVYLHTNVLHSLILSQFLKENNLELDFSFNTFYKELISKLGDKVKLREVPKNLTTTPISNE